LPHVAHRGPHPLPEHHHVRSAIKRDLGVKDWGRMIEGHGRILDRMDSVLFASPLFFHLTRYYFAT
jgi:phosphatidate cytidylyltransferase